MIRTSASRTCSYNIAVIPKKRMLKKGETHHSLNLTKKNKQYTEPSQSYQEFNKENLCSRSLLEPLDDSHTTEHPNKSKNQELSGNGSTLISPTFQSIPQLSLKDHLYKQDASYINVNFSLKELAKKNGPVGQDEERLRKSWQEVEMLKQQLVEHYKSKKYWSKISALFQKPQVDSEMAVLAWQESIDKYKSIKTAKEQLQAENEHLFQEKQHLQGELAARDQKILSLQKQIMQDKNETKVLSQKKCRGCENLDLKQKQYQQLYGQHKKTLKQLQQLKEIAQEAKEQSKKLQQKYNNLAYVKQELEKKNGKLFERQKQLTSQLQKVERAMKEDCSSSKDLHIQIEKLKQEKYQLEKTLSKSEEKHRREGAELKAQLSGLQQQKKMLSAQVERGKSELNDAKARVLKMQLQLQDLDQSLKIKTIQCEDNKRRHIENMGEELRRKNELEQLLKAKDEQLKKAYLIADQVQNAKVSLEMELNQQRKALIDREEELSKQIQLVKQLQDRLRENEQRLREYQQKMRQFEQSEHRIREAGQGLPHRHKNLNLANFQGNTQSTSPQANSLLIRICSRIRDVYSMLSDNGDCYQKRKPREEASEQRSEVNLLKTQRFVNEIMAEFSNLRNKYEFVWKENETLKMQIDNEATYKAQEAQQLQREIDLKEEALRAISAIIPEELKEIVVEFLCMTEQLAKEEHHEMELEEYEELKVNLQAQAREWKEHYLKLDRKLKRTEEELRRLEDQNQQMRRKLKAGEPKRQLQTEYDYKKDIRKKYNI